MWLRYRSNLYFSVSGQFNNTIVSHQVKYLGLMENLRVRRAGFAYRRPYEAFLHRYKCLSLQTWPNHRGPAKEGVQSIVCALGYNPDEYRMGKTKIFIRFPKTLFDTEDAFQLKKNYIAAIIQSNWKGYIQRKQYQKQRASAIIMQKWIRRYLAQHVAARRRHAVNAVRKFIKGFITRNDAPNEANLAFIELAKVHWLNKLAKNLPQNVLCKVWPGCPVVCEDASKHLKKYYYAHLSRKYRLNLTTEEKEQFELKVLAEKTFKGRKLSYPSSIGTRFENDRVSIELQHQKTLFMSTTLLPSGEKLLYSSLCIKYDRHGYKPRDRVLAITDRSLYLLETKHFKIKHKLLLINLEFVITSHSDDVCLIKIPVELKKDKGDLILELPFLIETMTMLIHITRQSKIVNIVDTKT